MYTSVSSWLKIGFKAVDEQGSHQNGKHLLGLKDRVLSADYEPDPNAVS